MVNIGIEPARSGGGTALFRLMNQASPRQLRGACLRKQYPVLWQSTSRFKGIRPNTLGLVVMRACTNMDDNRTLSSHHLAIAEASARSGKAS